MSGLVTAWDTGGGVEVWGSGGVRVIDSEAVKTSLAQGGLG